jgi:hypothetical protein
VFLNMQAGDQRPAHQETRMSTKQPLRGTRTLLSLGLTCVALVACNAPSSDAPSMPVPDAQAVHEATVAAGSARDPVASADPNSVCRLLSNAQVQEVFPSAHAGEPERTRQKYGISACIWSGDFGRLALQTWQAKGRTADAEASDMVSGFIDPLSSAAAGNIRYESIADIGEQAVAVVEKQDSQRGILTDVAMLVVRKDDRIIMLLCDDLAQRDRVEALAVLKSLGAAASNRR